MNSWGRWGTDDERGAVNLVTDDVVLRGLNAASTGRVISLAATIQPERGTGVVGRPTPQHFMLRDGGDYAAGHPESGGFAFADDVVTMPTHGVTHVDSLAHVWRSGSLYNGHPATSVTSRGASKCGIEKAGPIATRGVFVDLVPDGAHWLAPSEAVRLSALQDALRSAGEELEPGDALLVRTGWLEAWEVGEADASAWPGLHHECGSWLAERGVVLVGADNIGVEVFPSRDPNCQVPMHLELIREHGVYLCELLDLSALAAEDRSSFLFIASPLPFAGAVGGPVCPVAVL